MKLARGRRNAGGLEPAADAGPIGLVGRPLSIRYGVRLTIRGRSVRLRGLKKPPSGALRWLLLLGPGLVAAAAGNDAGGIATYASAGAKYGYDLLWVLVLITLSLYVTQEMCSRLGAATGRGLLELIRERFGLGWALVGIVSTLVANGCLVITEFVGVGEAVSLFGLSRYVAIPIAAAVVWWLVIYGNYKYVEKVFIAMTLIFFAYPVAAVLAHPDWGAVLRGAFVPTMRMDAAYLVVLVGLLGTTVTPYMQLFQQSAVVEKGIARRHYGPERIDTLVGAVFSNLMSLFMVLATAATLHAHGHRDIDSAADAARSLEPLAGHGAAALFGIGLLGASLLAGAVLPLATSYAVAEAFGFPKGVNLDFRQGRVFFSLFTVLVAVGAGLAMIPGLPVIPLLLGTQVLNGVLLPVTLVFILLLVNDERLVGHLRNSHLSNVLGWGTLLLVGAAVAALLGLTFFHGTGS